MSTPAAVPTGRIAQMRQAYVMTKQSDRWIGLILAATFLVTGAIAAALGLATLNTAWWGILLAVTFALMTASLVTLIVFGRRAEKSMYAQAEGQLGAGAGVLQMLSTGWTVAPTIAFTKQQDLVHRVLGRPGVILVGEGGSHARVRNLLQNEAKKHQRIVGDDVPVHTFIVGRGENEIPLPKLNKTVKKLKKALKPAEQTDLLNKLKALDAVRPAAPIPRGPVPTSTKGARKMMRG